MVSQTPFVRQNTPHPKELKAKAHKLLAGRSPETVTQKETPTTNGLPLSPPAPTPAMELPRVSQYQTNISTLSRKYFIITTLNK